MELTIIVSDKMLKQVVQQHLENDFYNNYSKAVLKAAGVPAAKTLLTTVMSDFKFINTLHGELTDQLNCWVEDYLEDAILEVGMPVGDLLDACELANEQQLTESDAEWQTQQDADAIKRTIKALQLAGYDVVKR